MSEENWNNNEPMEPTEGGYTPDVEPKTDAETASEETVFAETMSNEETEQDSVNFTLQDVTESEPANNETGDHMYRFENLDVKPKKDMRENKEKKSGGMGRIVAAAAIFGVIAALCFYALIMISGVGFPSQQDNEIDTVDTNSSIGGVTATSGAAVGAGDVSGIVESVMPSIVSITETSTVSSYFGQSYPEQGAGSGFIVKEDSNELLIVTNNHVVEGADSITVTFIDEEVVKATVKGTDSTSDLAILSVKISDLKSETKSKIKVASLGHSDDVKVGQMAIAIGNALGYGQSVTVGYISAKDREVKLSDDGQGSKTMVLLQTDAAINPGNSGGALLDANGNVIGINSVKYADTSVEGIGYAIPMSDAIPIINELMQREVLSDDEKGYLGITGRTVSESLSEAYGFPVGVYVSEVSEKGAASEAGIKQGDVITKINDVSVTTIEQVQNKVNNTKAGTEITVTIQRSQDGEYKEQEVKVTLKDADTLDGLSSENNQNSTDGSQSGNDSYGGNGQIVPW